MEVNKSQLLEASDTLGLDKEEIEGIDSQIFHIVTRETLERYLATIRNLKKQSKQQETDIKSIFEKATKFGQMFDAKSPMKSAMKIAGMINNPGKYKEDIDSFTSLYKKYNDKQLTDGKEAIR